LRTDEREKTIRLPSVAQALEAAFTTS